MGKQNAETQKEKGKEMAGPHPRGGNRPRRNRTSGCEKKISRSIDQTLWKSARKLGEIKRSGAAAGRRKQRKERIAWRQPNKN